VIIAEKYLLKGHSDIKASMFLVVAAKNKMFEQKLIKDCIFCRDL
jgi:hypothetical protein